MESLNHPEGFKGQKKETITYNENTAQIRLAQMMIGGVSWDQTLTDGDEEQERQINEHLQEWIGGGYSKPFRKIIESDPSLRKRVHEGDWSVLEEIKDRLEEATAA